MANSTIILGLAKTGTTGQYKLIKQSTRARFGDVLAVFEPNRRALMKSLALAATRGEPVVTKVMMAREADLLVPYRAFSKRVMVVRDPRDMIVSFMLFRPMLLDKSLPPQELSRRFNRFLDAIRARVEGGGESVCSIHALANQLKAGGVNWHRIADLMERKIQLQAETSFHVSTYEDFVNGSLDGLLDYLDAKADADPALTEIKQGADTSSDWLSHISRSGRTGEWRSWFTKDDINFFRPLLARYMNHFGYEDDWDISERSVIAPESTVDYLEKKFAQLTSQMSAVQRTVKEDGMVEADLPLITQKADDGDIGCIHSLIKFHAARGEEGAREADHWRHKAALLGQPPV